LPLIKNLPTSYTLKEPIDFNTIERNYTYDWLYGQQLKKLEPKSPGFDMFSFFDSDLFAMREYKGTNWYNGGGYLVY
jgi:hypothetical protein